MVQNSVRTTNPENRLIGFFLDSENRGGSQNENLKKKNQGSS
jgi:hypothetical protein